MAKRLKIPFLGRIPLEPAVVEASDSGRPFIYHCNQTGAAQAFREGIIKTIIALDDR
jgi:septum formation inhibitor-activating ATPase MinD